MADQHVNLWGRASGNPDASGDVFAKPYDIVDTGAVISPMVLIFKDGGAKVGFRGSFRMPEDYVGTPNLNIVFTANATTGNVVWDWSVLPRSGTEDMGAAAARTSETDTQAGPTTAFNRAEADMPLTAGDYAAGDMVLFELFRDALSGSDTLTAEVAVFSIDFEYADA